MNKRIKELMDQAAKQYYADTGEIKPDAMMYIFAELLIKECDRYVAERYDEMEPWMEPGDLLKHFGVKE
jgi:hypothetical protein